MFNISIGTITRGKSKNKAQRCQRNGTEVYGAVGGGKRLTAHRSLPFNAFLAASNCRRFSASTLG
jgi:hypothetical protein